MILNHINIEGAYQHNLKGISLKLPRNKFIVITGVSGSGKSSLAFDTLYAEGHRRYVESLSSYARQFLNQLEKPEVDLVEGLSPAISIEQRTTTPTPRSTVGTVTEIYDFLRLLYAKTGVPHCPDCGHEVKAQSSSRIVEEIMSIKEGARLHIMAPIVKSRKGIYSRELNEMREKGFIRARIDGKMMELDTPFTLERNKRHNIDIVIDSLIMKKGIENRVASSLETAFKLASNTVVVNIVGKNDRIFSKSLSCPDCGISFQELSSRNFSFNSPRGYCQECKGLGNRKELAVQLLIPDSSLSIMEGAVRPWGKKPKLSKMLQQFKVIAEKFGFTLDSPFKEMNEPLRELLIYGKHENLVTPEGEKIKIGKRDMPGLIPSMLWQYNHTSSGKIRDRIEHYMHHHRCSSCEGKRLNKMSLSVLCGDKNISDLTSLSLIKLKKVLEELRFEGPSKDIGSSVINEITDRLDFLLNVGLGYLTLDRRSSTLSGGESQRIRLATQVGSKLKGILYVLDEPSIGLHRRDNLKLLNTLKKMRDLGNTVIVVEHDAETINEADYVVDMGPGAGTEGGHIIATGTPAEIAKNSNSLTGNYLSGNKKIPVPETRTYPDGRWLEIMGISENNLKHINVAIPLGLITVITGVSGSGKSTLMNDVIYRIVARELQRQQISPGKFKTVKGLKHLKSAILVDQSSIGRSTRSNPATYTGVWTPIRDLFSKLPLSRMRGYSKGRFSFNVKGGRCAKCEGMGEIKVEMRLLPDLFVKCDSCNGKRFDRETLEIKYKGKNIQSVLDMTVSEAASLFSSIPEISRKLNCLSEIGLGYLKLGQSSTTLSGGEAQRLKLSKELSGKKENILYLLDEPTVGLHFNDIKILLEVLVKLRNNRNTIVIIEHNYDVIKCADWIIDLGPEGGENGGKIIAKGKPEEIAKNKNSYTGIYLKELLNYK